MNRRSCRLLIIALAGAAPVAAVADCLRPPQTPTSDFLLSDQGWAIHRPSGLMWTRCDMGAVYSASTNSCGSFNQTLSWRTALDAVELTNANQGQAGFHDWRLPTVKELASLLDPCDIDSFAINTEVFPLRSGVSPMYWTSTPVLTPTVQPPFAYIVNFNGGAVYENRIEQSRYVRLVRDASGAP